jgi:predicted amidohydrolase
MPTTAGTEGDLTYIGNSVIAGPHGEILAQAGETPTLLSPNSRPATPPAFPPNPPI